MMLDIVSIVRELVPDLLTSASPSVASVCTTRPKYLVFDGDPAQPACVLEFGEPDRLQRIDRILRALRGRMSSGTPASLCCAEWRPGTYVHVQEGLPGAPWFRVSEGIVSEGQWRRLLDRSVDAMRRLHVATRRLDAWTGRVDVAAELERQVALCRSRGIALADATLARAGAWGREATASGSIATCWQHGDFSLNNLLVAPDSVAIIDFEEFGGTSVPLHDAFGLALSVTLSQGEVCTLPRQECIRACLSTATADEAVEPECIPALLLHHLLWRVNQCHGLPRRAPLARTLSTWIDQLVAAPQSFLGQLAQ
ncbi:MAG TPA: phosphotransferase [Vicinamibacterales bacterium]|nr:phosphotransferase [Vicinamibacterales bacterium]